MASLKITKQNKQFYIIKFDDQIRGILNLRILRKLELVDNELTEINPDLAEIVDQEIINTAWRKFTNWIAFSERSIAKSRQYLLHIPLAQDITDILINKALEYNYLNDDRFTRLMIESLIDKRKSPIEIKHKLREHQIPAQMIDELLNELYDQETLNKIMENLVEQLYFRWEISDVNRRENKICEKLSRRGFDYHQVKEIFYRINNASKNNDQ